jgi:hypothetical protein
MNSSLFSAFFRNGQVIETFRGKGIWQPAVDLAIEKVNNGGWVSFVCLTGRKSRCLTERLDLLDRYTCLVKVKCVKLIRTIRKTVSPS